MLLQIAEKLAHKTAARTIALAVGLHAREIVPRNKKHSYGCLFGLLFVSLLHE